MAHASAERWNPGVIRRTSNREGTPTREVPPRRRARERRHRARGPRRRGVCV